MGSLAKTRVLVVDDNPDILAFMRTWLELNGYQVALAHDGVEALDVADEWRPDVILMDLAMPRMDGFEAARRLGDRPWRRDALSVGSTASPPLASRAAIAFAWRACRSHAPSRSIAAHGDVRNRILDAS